MTKLIGLTVFTAALAYTLYLVIFKKSLPELKGNKGWKRQFILAVLLMVGIKSGDNVSAKDKKLTLKQIKKLKINSRKDMVSNLRFIWKTIFTEKKYTEFNALVTKGVKNQAISEETGKLLIDTYTKINRHYHSSKANTRCYYFFPEKLSMKTRESLMKKIQLLREQRDKETLDTESLRKLYVQMAKDIELLTNEQQQLPKGELDKLLRQLEKDTINNNLIPSNSAWEVSELILNMENEKLKDSSPNLSKMIHKLTLLFDKGPKFNDWADPGIKNNIRHCMFKLGLHRHDLQVECYKRAAFPVKERSKEMTELKKRLLDEKLKEGTLTVEIYEKLKKQNPAITPVVFSSKKEIRDFQKKARRAIRKLYKQGELTTDFINQVEDIIGIDIIRMNPEKALQNDMRYYLQTLLSNTYAGPEILKELEKQKLIPKQKNHRSFMTSPKTNPDLTSQIVQRFKNDLTKLQSNNIDKSQFPVDSREYRINIYRVLITLENKKVIPYNSRDILPYLKQFIRPQKKEK